MPSRRWLLLSLLALAPAPVVALHNHLTKSTPTADSAGPAPKEIRLWFAENVDPRFSSISLLTSDSTKLAIGKPQGTDDPLSIASSVATPLPPGDYLVVWRTAGDDGHAVRGKFRFTVK
jgi:methionine-rich copper-binding protein CopC